ncbi:phosphatase PAP2 family protein [Chlorobaculum sp. 24CR]|uniref:phosphatase PAP2 family protein n=1 Tax=Chlorobaculum sp. 24CR TaxID=2508878 RepID=UPI00100AB73F|nr:phosphatase PAP2 family protein [Chlorobaculum sp. 24CR]RXK84546.1 phosphatase PAP2 family protein [Chlorobaculum sp. 24CR]
MSISSLDSSSIAELSAFLGGNGIGNKLFRLLIYNVGENPLLRGVPIFFPLLLLWFGNASAERRSRILTGLLATCAAVGISVSMQYLVPVHTRPVLDPALSLQMATQQWDHDSSFPSDTAMLYFALSTTIFLLNRRAGIAVFLWSLLSAGLCRVALGWHYPSDIFGSLVIAPAVVLLFDKTAMIRGKIQALLESSQNRMAVINAVLALFIAEAYNLFPGLRSLVETLVRIIRKNFDLPG